MANRISNVDKKIDFNSITIDVNGRVNGNKVNKGQVSRWSDNINKDGFIYTSSTEKQQDGTFNYKFTDINMGENMLNILGATGKDADAAFRIATHYRDNTKNEGVINSVSALDDGKSIKGKTTDNNNFRYNEGNALTNEEVPHPSIDGTNSLSKLGEGYSDDQLSFYDKNAYNWVEEVRSVRNLTK